MACLLSVGTSNIHAASTDYMTISKTNRTAWNFTGSSAAEKVKVKVKKSGKKITSVKVYVNNKKAGTLSTYLVSNNASKYTLFRLSNGKTYLYLASTSTNSRDIFYKWSKGRFRLVNYVTHDYDDGADVTAGLVGVSGKSVSLNNFFYGYRTGTIQYERKYTLKNGKFVSGKSFRASSPTAKVANRTINFTVKPKSNDVAFTLKKGQRATVYKIVFKGKKVYVIFKKNGKRGYLRNVSSKDLYFKS
jgi:hypothetical protein